MNCIRVTSSGHVDVDLFFDAESSMLTSCKYGLIDPDPLGKRAEVFFNDYTDLDGLKYARKVTVKIDGKVFLNEEVLELRPLKEFPPATFAKPGEVSKNSDKERTEALITRAITAHGGKDKLALLQRYYLKTKATALGQGFSMEEWTELFLRSKTIVRPDQNARVRGNVQIVDRAAGWVNNDDKGFKPLTNLEVKVRRDSLYRENLRLLYPIIEDRHRFDVRYKGDVTVDGRPADWIRVTAKGESDVDLYFERKSGLLVGLFHGVSGSPLGKNARYIFSDYKDFDGLMYPQKKQVWGDDKLIAETTVVELRFIQEFPDATFSKP
jgi:hypothetical protein